MTSRLLKGCPDRRFHRLYLGAVKCRDGVACHVFQACSLRGNTEVLELCVCLVRGDRGWQQNLASAQKVQNHGKGLGIAVKEDYTGVGVCLTEHLERQCLVPRVCKVAVSSTLENVRVTGPFSDGSELTSPRRIPRKILSGVHAGCQCVGERAARTVDSHSSVKLLMQTMVSCFLRASDRSRVSAWQIFAKSAP